jgi:hypothetical protein
MIAERLSKGLDAQGEIENEKGDQQPLVDGAQSLPETFEEGCARGSRDRTAVFVGIKRDIGL